MTATESGTSWLAERAPMMPFGLCMCRATWCQPRTAADGAPQENPVSNRGPSIRHGKKDTVGERGLLKTTFPMKLSNDGIFDDRNWYTPPDAKKVRSLSQGIDLTTTIKMHASIHDTLGLDGDFDENLRKILDASFMATPFLDLDLDFVAVRSNVDLARIHLLCPPSSPSPPSPSPPSFAAVGEPF